MESTPGNTPTSATAVQAQLTPHMSALLTADAARKRLWYFIGAGICVLVGWIAPAFVGLSSSTAIIIGELLGIAIAGLLVWQGTRIVSQARLDASGGTYMQVSGPLKTRRHVSYDSEGDETYTYFLDVADQHFSIDRATFQKLSPIASGTVDYAPHRRLIFEVRDASGQVTYRHPKYRPPSA